MPVELVFIASATTCARRSNATALVESNKRSASPYCGREVAVVFEPLEDQGSTIPTSRGDEAALAAATSSAFGQRRSPSAVSSAPAGEKRATRIPYPSRDWNQHVRTPP